MFAPAAPYMTAPQVVVGTAGQPIVRPAVVMQSMGSGQLQPTAGSPVIVRSLGPGQMQPQVTYAPRMAAAPVTVSSQVMAGMPAQPTTVRLQPSYVQVAPGYNQPRTIQPAPVAYQIRQQPQHPETARTAGQPAVSPADALKILQDGNGRFVADKPARKEGTTTLREVLADKGQNPLAAVIGCADSRCPLETLFDLRPGDLFVLRNAGNACADAEPSIVGSLEFAVGALGTRLLLVVGHTKCGAMVGATKTAMASPNGALPPADVREGSLEEYLRSLAPVAWLAKDQLGEHASLDELVAQTTRLNVFVTIQRLLEFSPVLREKAAKGEIELHGAIYDIESGTVDFMGQHPMLRDLLN